MNWLRRIWLWLITPVPTYPNPPVPRDENAAGVGWSGDRKQVRPFNVDNHR